MPPPLKGADATPGKKTTAKSETPRTDERLKDARQARDGAKAWVAALRQGLGTALRKQHVSNSGSDTRFEKFVDAVAGAANAYGGEEKVKGILTGNNKGEANLLARNILRDTQKSLNNKKIWITTADYEHAEAYSAVAPQRTSEPKNQPDAGGGAAPAPPAKPLFHAPQLVDGGLKQANYAGAGTDLHGSLAAGVKPLTPSDAAAQMHDIDYSTIPRDATPEVQGQMKAEADKKFVGRVLASDDNLFNKAVTAGPMMLNMVTDAMGVTGPNTFTTLGVANKTDIPQLEAYKEAIERKLFPDSSGAGGASVTPGIKQENKKKRKIEEALPGSTDFKHDSWRVGSDSPKKTSEPQPQDTEHLGKNQAPSGQANPENPTTAGQGAGDAQPNGGIGAAYGQHMAAKTYRAAQQDTTVGQTTGEQSQANRPGEKDDLKIAAGSDQIIGGPQTQNNALATMRPLYPQPNGSEVVPSARKQLQSDIAFDMFSVVRPGFGLGADNKLFVQQDIWEKKIQGMNPHTFPRGNGGANGGPEGGLKPSPWPLQNVMTKGQVGHLFDRVAKRTNSIANIARRTHTRTINALPDDIVGSGSAKGLKRKPSPLEPIYNHHEPWLPYNEQAGIFLNRRGFKHQYNPMRTPLRVERDPLNGMQTLNKRRALEVILQ